MNVNQIPKEYISEITSSKKKRLEGVDNVYLKFKSNDEKLNEKLKELQNAMLSGFNLYNKIQLQYFIEGHNDINSFVEQFIKLNEYYKTHSKSSMTVENYKLRYGETLGAEKYNKQQSKNPFRNHNGRLSPFKKGSVNYSEEAIKKADENRTYNTRLDYWLGKGYSLEESKQKLKERQTTFSLEKCIKKYGEIKGKEIWKERQKKWQNTLKSKPLEEINRINMSKSSGSGNVNKGECYLYYIKFYNDETEFWKVGITSKTLEQRFRLKLLEHHYNLKYKILFLNKLNTIDEAYYQEQYILEAFKEYRIYTDYNGFKTIETFSKDVLRGFYAVK